MAGLLHKTQVSYFSIKNHKFSIKLKKISKRFRIVVFRIFLQKLVFLIKWASFLFNASPRLNFNLKSCSYTFNWIGVPTLIITETSWMIYYNILTVIASNSRRLCWKLSDFTIDTAAIFLWIKRKIDSIVRSLTFSLI